MRRHPERSRREASKNSSINYPRAILAATLLLLLLYFGYRALSVLLLGTLRRADIVPPQNIGRDNPQHQPMIPERPVQNILNQRELHGLQEYYQQVVANLRHHDFHVRRQAQQDLVEFEVLQNLPLHMRAQHAEVMHLNFQNRLLRMRQDLPAQQMPDNHGAAREIGLFGRQNQFADQNERVMREIRRNDLNQANQRRF